MASAHHRPDRHNRHDTHDGHNGLDRDSSRYDGLKGKADDDQSDGASHLRSTTRHSRRWAVGSIAILLIYATLAIYGVHRHLMLPDPRPLLSPSDPFFSETAARRTLRVLANDIGLRAVGTGQEDRARDFLMTESVALKLASETHSSHLTIDIHEQKANGTHRFNSMGQVVKISCGPECDKHALLLNAHYDSTLFSPDASDGGAGIAIILEVMRVLTHTPKTLKNSVIFLFNSAEETLQDASHALVTQHKLVSSIRAVLNLEAMGVKGKEFLFQASSDTLVDAYRRVPHPHGASISNAIFATGFVKSDTDFRQFVQYGDMAGLDFAFYQNSYVYHTMLDVEENIQDGSLQHFGDNILALVEYIIFEADLSDFSHSQNVIYYDYLGMIFVYYTKNLAATLHYSLVALLVVFAIYRHKQLGLSSIGAVFEMLQIGQSLLSSIFHSVVTALFLTYMLGNAMSWFSREWLPIVLFGAPTIRGLLSSVISKRRRSTLTGADPISERRTFLGIILLWGVLLFFSTYNSLDISFLLSFHVGSLLCGQVMDTFMTNHKDISITPVSVFVYATSMLMVVPYFITALLSMMMLVVPFTGRVSSDIPVDILVSVLTALLVFIAQGYLIIPVFYRLHRKTASTLYRMVTIACVVTVFVFSSMMPYDSMHPKRVFIKYVDNTTSGDRSIALAYMDPARSHDLIIATKKKLGVKGVRRTRLETDRDWSTLSPIIHLIDSYVFNVTEQTTQISNAATPPRLTWTSAYDSQLDQRHISLSLDRPGLISTVLSFTADVISWSIGDDTLSHAGESHQYALRSIRGGDNSDRWNMTMVVKGDAPLWVEVSGVERDGFHTVSDVVHPVNSQRMAHRGMLWKWSDQWASAKILSVVQDALPPWASGFYMGVVIVNYIV
ncbi:hypothetical protein BASA61_009560 [Batrachochytrium salamandrivorans]|nr:hypothetical protein BASA61_009560 [Batrachochytrium salamandrivorans]